MESHWMVLLISVSLVFHVMTFDLSEKFSTGFVFAQSNSVTQTANNPDTNHGEESRATESSSDQGTSTISGEGSIGSGNQISCNSIVGHKLTNGIGLTDSIGICTGNGNQPIQPSPGGDDELATLSISKIIECDSEGGNPNDLAVCSYVLNNVFPAVFSFVISGNNPNPSNFPASEEGTEVSIGAGDYRIVENVDDEIIQTIKNELNADELGVIPQFTGDCTPEFPSLNSATGSVDAGDSVECNVTNNFVVQGGTAPS